MSTTTPTTGNDTPLVRVAGVHIWINRRRETIADDYRQFGMNGELFRLDAPDTIDGLKILATIPAR